jgi:hypothetical protein
MKLLNMFLSVAAAALVVDLVAVAVPEDTEPARLQ